MTFIPQSHQDLLKDETRALAYLATLMPDGTPQVTPLWFTTDEKYILISSAKGRVKDKNMRARPAVAVVIQDPNDVNRYIQVRGLVEEVTEVDALELIDQLSVKYRDKHWTPRPAETRVTYKILPSSVFVDE
jgi:PPOX class probable F420-dependent enzyme